MRFLINRNHFRIERQVKLLHSTRSWLLFASWQRCFNWYETCCTFVPTHFWSKRCSCSVQWLRLLAYQGMDFGTARTLVKILADVIMTIMDRWEMTENHAVPKSPRCWDQCARLPIQSHVRCLESPVILSNALTDADPRSPGTNWPALSVRYIWNGIKGYVLLPFQSQEFSSIMFGICVRFELSWYVLWILSL